jgi:hypothetical protein
MISPARLIDTAPFPPLPPAPDGAADGWPAACRLRRFGTRLDDLQVDLEGDRRRAASEVVACCTEPAVSRETSLRLPVGKRIECLLILAALDGADHVDVDLRCPSCGQPLEVTLGLDELLAAGRRAGARTVDVEVGGTIRRFRRPDGRDEDSGNDAPPPEPEDLRRDIAAALLASDDGPCPVLTAADLDRIEAALDEADPLVRGAVLAACPDCGHASEHEVDLAGFALERLRRSQDALIETVHLLASRYHWTEADILSLPEWRRALYVRRLRDEAGR